MRQYTCHYCKQKSLAENMHLDVKETETRTYRKYFHHDCFQKHEQERAFKQKEYAERDELVKVIMEVHDIKCVPHQFFPYLEELRNGSVLFGRVEQRYKEGFSYPLIQETYLALTDTIKTAVNNIKRGKGFQGGVVGELRYALSIIKNNIDNVRKMRKQTEVSREIETARVEHKEHVAEIRKLNKKKDDLNISEFLEGGAL